MGTLEKSSKSHEISTSTSRFAKNDDFQLRNASDNVKRTIRTGNKKIDDSERKMLRFAENRGKSMHFFRESYLSTRQNMLRNHDFPGRRRWGPYKKHPKVMKF